MAAAFARCKNGFAPADARYCHPVPMMSDSAEPPASDPAARLLGQPMRRVEDRALLMGRGRYVDDFPVSRQTLHAHVLRSPHAHAVIRRIDIAAALAQAGVHAVITGEDVRKLSDPFLVALKVPVPQWALAVERVRYVGEPVALILADSRYLAEDAAELIAVEYEPLPVVVDPRAAAAAGAVLLHPDAGTNVVSSRHFTYGDPDGAFARAEKRVSLEVEYPRNSFTPMECFVVVAEHSIADGSYDVLANFQGPFSIHPVMARALRVQGAEAAPAHAARQRRQFRHQAFHLSLHRSHGPCLAHRRPAGEMGGGPAGASAGGELRSQPRQHGRGRGHA